MSVPLLSIKIDVDTDRGTRIGVPNLLALFEEFDISLYLRKDQGKPC